MRPPEPTDDPGAAPKIVVAGSTMMELIAEVERMPVAGESVVGSGFRFGFGGKGANQAVMAARLGAQVSFISRVGNDHFGEMMLSHLEAAELEIRLARVAGESTGTAPIWVDAEGVNRIVVIPGANAHMTASVVREEMCALDPADCVVCQLETPQDGVAEAFRIARRWGAITILNPAPAARLDPDVLALADWLVPNESEFETLFGAPIDERSLARAAREVDARIVVTLGPKGVVASFAGEILRMPVPRVEVVDTTGAGDAFTGGFAYALAAGEPPIRAIALGNACGALSVTRPGTQTSFPTGAEVTALAGE